MTTELRGSREPLKAHDSDLSGSRFSGTNMARSGFDDVNLRAASFTDCNLSEAMFTDVNLANASIENANIEGLKINDANMARSGFDDVNLRAASFTDCNLSDAVFADVNLANASIENANIDGLKINGVPVSARMANASGMPGAVVFAKDIDRMARFYEQAASLSSVHADDDCIVLESMHFQLTVHAIQKHVADAIVIDDPPAPRANAAMKLCLPVASIADARTTASAFGGRVNPAANEWDGRGFRACDGHDPEGNVIQFRESAGAGRE